MKAYKKLEDTFYNNLKEPFLKYEKIRQSGKYNMITEASKVMSLINCDTSTYMDIINNYSELKKRFL